MSLPISIEADEWALLAGIASSLDLDEAEGEAIWFVANGGVRRWIAEDGDGAAVEVRPKPFGGQPCKLALSPRLVWFADQLARREGACTLSVVDGRTATASGLSTSAAVDLAQGTAPDLPPGMAGATATVAAGELAHLLDAACCLPEGVDLAQAEAPALWLAIQPRGVSVHVDWTSLGAPRATYSTTAATTGQAVVAVVASALRRLLSQPCAADEPVTLTLDPDASHALAETATWRLLVPAVEATVTRFAPRLDAILDDAGLARRWVSPRVVTFGGPQEIRAELHPTTPEIVRLSSIVAAGVPETADLVQEINQLNAGLVAVRVWMESNHVVAAVDLPCARLVEIIDTAAQLVREVQGLGAFVSGLAGVERFR